MIDLMRLELAEEILREYRGVLCEPVRVDFSEPLAAEIVCKDGKSYTVTGLFAQKLKAAPP